MNEGVITLKKFKSIRNERGSMSIEFIGILPFYFMFFLLLWQVVASGYAVLSLKSAANDGAQVYALTGDYREAVDAVKESIGDSSLLTNPLVTVSSGGPGLFDLKISAKHSLVFIPEKYKSKMSVPINSEATGKVMLQ